MMKLTDKIEEDIESAYWEFDAIKKGYSGRNVTSERDAFKMVIRQIISNIPEQKNSDTWIEP